MFEKTKQKQICAAGNHQMFMPLCSKFTNMCYWASPKLSTSVSYMFGGECSQFSFTKIQHEYKSRSRFNSHFINLSSFLTRK